MVLRSAAFCLAAVLVTAGCGGGGNDEAATLASGAKLPAKCAPGKVGRGSTVTFVARGEAWALNPRTGRAVCLFAAPRPGPFEWGPRADRALLARLEVKPLGDAPSRRPSAIDPATVSWGQPTGKSIVFVSRDGHRLLKAHPGSRRFEDVTPLRDAEYTLVTYHPSGLAFAFVVRRQGHESIWISTNTGEKPEQLVHGRLHTGFDALAFGDAGQTLYFAARHRNGTVHVHTLPLVGATSAPIAWVGKPGRYVSTVLPGWPGFAITVSGSSCESTRAVIVTTKRAGATPLAERPSRAIGWLDDKHLLVEAGGCGGPLDLYSVEHATLAARLLVENVDAASVRRPEPLPPPPLPIRGERGSFA
ncbi:MAG TPA: hypothetical protein VGQ15_05345 [Gaiellaceae bacterium]|nr:hypothetical protein [Gaiellaceae bacterium]